MLSWVESIPPINGPVGSGFGTSIALDANILAAGAPLHKDTGAVFSSAFSKDDNWDLMPILYGEEAGDGFGMAIDVQGEQMVVGSPLRPMLNTLIPAGAAYFYAFNATGPSWEQVGPALRSSEDVLAANGEFGAAVALGLSELPRVVIGAPKHNEAIETLEAGRVYTFESAGSAWNTLETSPLLGKNAYNWFGASVDMTSDGSRIIAGAPGNGTAFSGYFQIYEWTETQWNLDYEEEGSPGEALGSSVVVLSDADDIFAVGGPGFEQGAGRVVVYQRQSSLQRAASDYKKLGEAIVGSPGDRLGSLGFVNGGVLENGIVLVLGTASGDVKSFLFDTSTGLWDQRFETLSTGTNGTVAVEYSSANGLMISVADADLVTLYGNRSTLVPMISPASAPVATPAPSTNLIVVPDDPVGTNTTTIAPVATSSPASWVTTGGNFTPKMNGTGFGSSVSLAASTMAVGAPLTLGNGAVFVYEKVSGVWETVASGQLFSSETAAQFGASVDVTDQMLIVGAPAVVANGTSTETGAAYCYVLLNGDWQLLGAMLRGDTSVYGSEERFGASVSSASTTRRVVVGAPGSSLDLVLFRGRVYVFEFVEASASWVLMQDAVGLSENSALGSSVDMSQDGTQLVVGAPGGGYAELYEYNGTAWVSVYQATQTGEGFGSAVALISPSTFAVGAPGYSSGRGRVVVYQKNDAGVFVQVGPAIEGDSGDQLGAANTISGDSSSTTPSVTVGTAIGTIKRYVYDSSTSVWVQQGATVDTGFGGGLTAVAAASQSQAFVAGGNFDAAIYELL